MAKCGGRDHRDDLLREGQEVDVECRQDGLEGITLFGSIDDREGDLAVSLEGVAVVRTPETLDSRTKLKTVVLQSTP